MSRLTKVAKGIAYGDVSNIAVRNILTEISKSINGNFTEQEMYDTLDFFDWKCPYTGKDLRPLIENDLGGYATDHVYPQNKEWCGLNVKGNLIIVDKEANKAKRDKDVETFILNDTKVLNGTDLKTRQARLAKIKDFQNQCGYDPEQIRQIVSPMMKERYDEIRTEQEQKINNVLETLKSNHIKTIATTTTSIKTPIKQPKKFLPELVFHSTDEVEFKNELIKSKKAHFVLTYESGAVKNSPWKAESFDKNSNLRANIQSRPFWRTKSKDGLIKVEVFID
jgi:hypothetical protein